MANDFFNATGYPTTRASGSSSAMRAQLAAIAAAFDKMPVLTGNGGRLVAVNAGATALEAVAAINGIPIGGTTPAAGAFTTLSASGNVSLGDAAADTLSVGGSTVKNGSGNWSLPAPSSGATLSLASVAGAVGLSVSSAAASDAQISLAAISYARDWRLKVMNANGAFVLRDETGAGDRMLVDISGNVGFSMTPTYKVDVTGSAGNGYRYVGPTAQVLFGEVGSKGAIGTLTNHALDFLTNGSAKMSLAAAGNLTISAPSSGYPLTAEANGTLAALFRNTNAGAVNAGIAFGSPGSNNLSAGVAGLAQSISTGNLILQYVTGSALTEGARLTSGGLLLVNRTTDSGLGVLQVNAGGSQVADFSGTGGGYINVRAPAAAIAGVRIGGNAVTVGTASFDLQQDSSGNADIVNRSNARLSLYTNSLERFQVSAAGQLFAQAIHNNASGASGTTPMVASGTYTPTITNVSHLASSTAFACQWTRVGNVVHVSGNVTLAGDAVSTLTEARLSLPISSALTANNNLGGSGMEILSPTALTMAICARAASDDADLFFTPLDTSSHTFAFNFTYVVL